MSLYCVVLCSITQYGMVLCSIVLYCDKIVQHFASLLPKQVSAKCDNDDNSTLWYSASPHSSTIIHLLPRCWIWKRFYTLEQRYVCLLPGTTFWDSKTYLLLPRQWIWRQFYTLKQITALLLSGAAFLKSHKMFFVFEKLIFPPTIFMLRAQGLKTTSNIKLVWPCAHPWRPPAPRSPWHDHQRPPHKRRRPIRARPRQQIAGGGLTETWIV